MNASDAADRATDDDLTLHEAAALLGVHYMTAYRYVRTGLLVASRSGSTWRVPAAEVRRFQVARATSPAVRAGTGTGRPGTVPVRSGLQRRLLAGDESGVWTALQQMLVAGTDPESLLVDVLSPAMVAIGARWAVGQLSVGDEHRATQVATRIVGRLGPQFRRRGVHRGTVVVGAPAGERHGLPVAMTADIVRGAGWDVIDLGADVPAVSFAEATVAGSRIVAVAVGVTVSGAELAVRQIVAEVGRLDTAVPVVVGGAAIHGAGHAHSLGADHWTGTDARSVVALLHRLPVVQPADNDPSGATPSAPRASGPGRASGLGRASGQGPTPG